MDFATAEHPLHPSGMRTVVSCPWRAVVSRRFKSEEVSGAAADTGSAWHKAIAAWHRGKDIADSITHMNEHIGEYPAADLSDASALFLRYVSRPENQNVDAVLVEQPIKFTIAPHPMDPTGEPICVEGTVDQVRRENGKLRVWDGKTSKKQPMAVMRNATMQVAAYCVGASVLLNERVDPGGIIAPRHEVMFWRYAWTFDDIEDILYGVRLRVAEIRSGHVFHVPSADNCDWCPARSPDLCLPQLQQLRLKSGL